MANAKRKGLGKGLNALISGASLDASPSVPAISPEAGPATALADGSRLVELDPSAIEPNPRQPRRVFEETALQELADSIRRDGVQEPVLVRKVGEKYELVSGERRVRASVMADMKVIPAVVREVSDRDMLRLGLIENIQREDLNPVETAQAYEELIREFKWTQEQLAAEVGKKRVTVTNTLRLLNLPEVVQEQIADGSLTMGHAKALLTLESPGAQIAGARKIIAGGLSVRQAEKMAAERKTPPKKKAEKDPNIRQLEDSLRQRLGAKVSLKTQNNGRGRIEIEYFNLDELERILDVLRVSR